MNVGISTLDRSKKILDKGAPELVEAVESGKLAVGAAYKVSELPKEEQAGAGRQEGGGKNGYAGAGNHGGRHSAPRFKVKAFAPSAGRRRDGSRRCRAHAARRNDAKRAKEGSEKRADTGVAGAITNGSRYDAANEADNRVSEEVKA